MAKVERDEKGSYVTIIQNGVPTKIYLEDEKEQKQDYIDDHNKKVEEMYKLAINNTKKIRERKGYTQQTFADKCVLSKNFISAVENGRSRVSAEVLINFAYTLGVPISELVEDTKNDHLPTDTEALFLSLNENNMKILIDFAKSLLAKQDQITKEIEKVSTEISILEKQISTDIQYFSDLRSKGQTSIDIEILNQRSLDIAEKTDKLSYLRKYLLEFSKKQ